MAFEISLTGKTAVITGSNSGIGLGMAWELARAGAEVILVSGPVAIDPPRDVTVVDVVSARDMQQAVERALPADIGVFVAAVADWRVESEADEKIKKDGSGKPPALKMTENPDILKGVGTGESRPALVVGFAAETENLIENARAKLAKKGADWIVANDVSPETGTFGGDRNTVVLVGKSGEENWPSASKDEVAERLVERITQQFETVEV